MLINKTRPTEQPQKLSTNKMLTMQEAMDYLSDKGAPCKSRATFYRYLADFGIEYVNLNPNGKNEIRRFKVDDLNRILEAKGLQ